jgi:hypothetical protein
LGSDRREKVLEGSAHVFDRMGGADFPKPGPAGGVRLALGNKVARSKVANRTCAALIASI